MIPCQQFSDNDDDDSNNAENIQKDDHKDYNYDSNDYHNFSDDKCIH
jgi:hypothetical protein